MLLLENNNLEGDNSTCHIYSTANTALVGWVTLIKTKTFGMLFEGKKKTGKVEFKLDVEGLFKWI